MNELNGQEAIDHAEQYDAQLYVYANEVDGDGGPITVKYAKKIIMEDPRLVYCRVAAGDVA